MAIGTTEEIETFRRRTAPGRRYGFDVPQPPVARRRAPPRGRGLRSRILMLISAGCCVALVGLFLAYVGAFDGFTEPPATAAPAVPPSETLRVANPWFTGFDKKKQAYAVAAESAREDAERPNHVHLMKVAAELKLRKNDDTVYLTADTGLFDNTADVLVLDDNIRVVTTNGYAARLSHATILLNERRMQSDHPVQVILPGGTIVANRVEMSDGGNRIRFSGGTRMRLAAPASKGAS